MRCLFCKQDSSDSKSVEHVIPESLGNKTYILPKGVVCDKCNNYFSRKIEDPFLNSTEIRALRFYEGIPNKKRNVPPVDGILSGKIPVKIYNPFPDEPMFTHEKGSFIPIEVKEADIPKIPSSGWVFTPAFTNDMIPHNTTVISRFIAKIALESIALRLYQHEGGLDYLINDIAFDPIRNYVRMGNRDNWPCNISRIYNMNKQWQNDGSFYHVLHESDFLFIPAIESIDNLISGQVQGHLYYIFALLGLEFTINVANSEPDGLEPYKNWLKENGNASPLYTGKNNRY